jgi:hypothetical protein
VSSPGITLLSSPAALCVIATKALTKVLTKVFYHFLIFENIAVIFSDVKTALYLSYGRPGGAVG